MRRNQQLDAVVAEVRAAGCQPRVIKPKRGHVRVAWTTSSGEERTIIIAGTSRSSTGVLNARAQARRMLRECRSTDAVDAAAVHPVVWPNT